MKWNEMNDERSCQYLSKFLAVINAFIINLLYTETWSRYGRWYMEYAIRYKVYAVLHTVSLFWSLASLGGYFNFVRTQILYDR